MKRRFFRSSVMPVVRRARLFGSAARGELTETSDLDFLVQMPGVAPFDEFMQMVDAQHRIEQLTGRSVDMAANCAPPHLCGSRTGHGGAAYEKLA